MYRLCRHDLEAFWTHWGVDPRRLGQPFLMERDQGMPPFNWADRYDLVGLALGVAVVGALVLIGASVLLAIVFGCAALNLTAYALRRRAGIPEATLWQRWRHARRAPR
jgi:hypothetical protein